MSGHALRLLVAVVLLAPAVLVSPSSAAAQEVTYADHVAPIVRERCVTCHREGGAAPMPLLTYEDARPYASLIKAKVESKCYISTTPGGSAG